MTLMDTSELRELLIRIDERVQNIQDDIQSINTQRRCMAHTEKIKTLEKMIWGCAATLIGIVARMAYETIR